jgi:hypothetical protein
MRVHAALLWKTGGEARQDDVLISSERANGSGARIVILDDQGRRRASNPAELPPGSVLIVPVETSMMDLHEVQQAGYSVRRPVDEEFEKRWAAAKATSREAAIEMADAELTEIIERLEAELRRKHPDFFDADGQLRTEYVNSKLLERTGGKRTLTREDVIRLTERPSNPPGKAHGGDAS